MIDVQPATIGDLVYIDSLQRKNAEELAFYPKAVFEREIPLMRILLARVNNEPAGYLYRGAWGPTVKIHQACIQYDLRGQLYGAALVRHLRNLCETAGAMTITLRCGSDIAANFFWKAMGFHCSAVTPGGVRRMRDINNWRLDLAPALFVIETEPSDKAADASLWRRQKGQRQTQFMRGRQLQQYRQQLVEQDENSQSNGRER